MTLDCAISRMSCIRVVSVFQNHPSILTSALSESFFQHVCYVCGCWFEGLAGLHKDPPVRKIAFILPLHYLFTGSSEKGPVESMLVRWKPRPHPPITDPFNSFQESNRHPLLLCDPCQETGRMLNKQDQSFHNVEQLQGGRFRMKGLDFLSSRLFCLGKS